MRHTDYAVVLDKDTDASIEWKDKERLTKRLKGFFDSAQRWADRFLDLEAEHDGADDDSVHSGSSGDIDEKAKDLDKYDSSDSFM